MRLSCSDQSRYQLLMTHRLRLSLHHDHIGGGLLLGDSSRSRVVSLGRRRSLVALLGGIWRVARGSLLVGHFDCCYRCF